MSAASGSWQYSQYHVRLKEFTVGPNGVTSMPGTLPPTTAYTYCVDLSVDEAEAHAVFGELPPVVSFSKPIVTYTREFLGLPVGMIMPSAYYDPRSGQWISSEDGLVVRVLRDSAGVALLDCNGDGLAEPQARYDSLSIDLQERQLVAGEFAEGDSLWRVRVDHFSARDYNLNEAAVAGTNSPTTANANQPATTVTDPRCTHGCIIEAENRVLGESIPVVGTPFSLNYRSNRQPGDGAMRWISIPLTGDTLPAGLTGVRAEVQVAGRTFKHSWHTPTAQAYWDFREWDGLDRYHRVVKGTVNATIRIGYEYKRMYATNAQGRDGGGFGSTTAGGGALAASGDRDDPTVLWSTQQVSLGVPSMEAAGLGGWTLSPHHIYDINGRGTLYRGDGATALSSRQYPIIKRWVGDGDPPSETFNPAGDGRELAAAIPTTVGGMVVRGDESVFCTDIGRGMVYRVSPEGRYYRVAGTGAGGVEPTDGEDAALVEFLEPTGIGFGVDGNLYFVDRGRAQVFRVDPSGKLKRVAGIPNPQYGSEIIENSPALNAALYAPSALTVGPDGSLYVVNYDQSQVVRILPNGRIRTFAGKLHAPSFDLSSGKSFAADTVGFPSISGIAMSPNGDLAIATPTGILKVTPDGLLHRVIGYVGGPDMFIRGLAYGPDGALYYTTTDAGGPGLARIEQDGTTTPVAGGNFPQTPGITNDGGYARGAQFNLPTTVALGPSGVAYLGTISPGGRGENFVWRIAPDLPGDSTGTITVPEANGRIAHVFTRTGRHLKTIDTYTGATLFTFEYSNGQLSRIVDVNGDPTSIERGSGGWPITIRAPYGQITTLQADGTGKFLGSVTNPTGTESYTLTYDNAGGGVLKSITNPRGFASNYDYAEGTGRLTVDHLPAEVGGTITFGPDADPGSGFSLPRSGPTKLVTQQSAEGQVTHYVVQQMLSGLKRRFMHQRYGGSWATTSTVDSLAVVAPYEEVVRTVDPSGLAITERMQRDPVFGFLAPYAKSVTRQTPSGVTEQWTISRSAADGHFVTTAIQNGASGAFTADYDSTHRVWTTSTPVGRTSTTTLDAAGRPLNVQVGSAATLDPIELGYYGNGRLESITQGGRSWHYEYDGSGRLRTVHDALQRTTTYSYNSADRVKGQALPGNRTVGYGFDANGNLDSLTTPGGALHTFAYTALDLNERYEPPPVAGVTDPATIYAYNRDRQLTQVTRPDGGLIRVRYGATTGLLDSLTQARGRNTFSYLPSGQLQSVTSPDSVGLTYGYDGLFLTSQSWTGLRGPASSDQVTTTLNMALLDSVQQINGQYAAAFRYDRDGLLDSVGVSGATERIIRRTGDGLLEQTDAGRVRSTYGYNRSGELTELDYTIDGAAFFHQHLERDLLGRDTLLAETIQGTTRTYRYRYDDAGRLFQVLTDNVVTQALEYDHGLPGNGNRTRFGPAPGDTAHYDAQDRMLSYGTRTYTYTSAGELTSRVAPGDTLRTTYDALGNLTGARTPSGDTLRYRVDGQNRRVQRTVNGHAATSWLYGDGIFVTAELDSTGTVRNRYVYGTQEHVPDLVIQGGTTYRLITDQLGSVRAAVDVNTGTVAQRIDYDAWGVITTDTAPEFQFLGYAGGLEDRGTGLVRFGARDYEAGVGRWVSRDPAGGGGGEGLYAYVHSSPMDFVDPAGLRAVGAGAYGPFREGDYPCPEMPTWASMARNMDQARRHKWNAPWFHDMVETNGPWDYKELTPDERYEDFGNFNYGATGTAAGVPLYILLREAGMHQKPNAGGAGKKPPVPGIPFGGQAPFGDDPKDQMWIIRGYLYSVGGGVRMPLVRVNWGRYAARLATVLLCLVGVACERDRASVVRVGPTSPDGNWRTYWMFLAGGGATTSRVYGVVVVPAQDTAALAGIKYGAYNVVLAWDKGRADAATVSWRGADTLAVVLDHGRACAYRSEVQVMRSGGIDVDVCVIRLFHR